LRLLFLSQFTESNPAPHLITGYGPPEPSALLEHAHLLQRLRAKAATIGIVCPTARRRMRPNAAPIVGVSSSLGALSDSSAARTVGIDRGRLATARVGDFFRRFFERSFESSVVSIATLGSPLLDRRLR
jgi:hypothetical protein